ncbi:alanine--tRNA ligase [Patescibacteria group bacterium]
MISSKDLRKKYIEFFKAKGHAEIPSASLIPENDPSVLFTTAGMHPLVPFLLGEKHPAGNQLVNFQKCIRTGDIDEVGDQWHLTFFEMLGNWSLGQYGKKEAIQMSFEFLTHKKWLNIPIEKLAISVFAGDDDAPFDKETFNVWKELGLPEDRIYKYGKKENWWSSPGEIGPCGPDSEMFYITDQEPCSKNCQPSCNCGHYVEIWNDVFMVYEKTKDKKYVPLKQTNIDTGMGVERVVAVLNGYTDNYQEILKPVIQEIEKLSGKKYKADKETTRSMRIIADHIRSATFIMGDEKGIAPSNVDQGYVVRKLIRRAIRHGKLIGINEMFCFKISEIVIKEMKKVYPELKNNKNFIIEQTQAEEEKFRKVLTNKTGQKKVDDLEAINKLKMVGIQSVGVNQELKNISRVDAKKAFKIYQERGIPLEEINKRLRERNLYVDEKEFEKEMQKHQDLSRTASAGKFKGGLADNSEQTIKYHTTAHLLLEALRRVLGEHVVQKGSNITEERLRLDFSHAEKMTDEQKAEVEKIVNEQIKKNLSIICNETTLDEAKKQNAMGVFANKYGNKVKVYSIGNVPTNVPTSEGTSKDAIFSKEICGGPHVKNTNELGKFKIKKEESSSAGVRRVKAILE